PGVIKLAKKIAQRIKTTDPQMIQEIQKSMGIDYVDQSMIGFYIYKYYKTKAREHDKLYGPMFYYEMLPDKYSKIDIPFIQKLIDFINYNFHGSDGIIEICDTKFSYFSEKTKNLFLAN